MCVQRCHQPLVICWNEKLALYTGGLHAYFANQHSISHSIEGSGLVTAAPKTVIWGLPWLKVSWRVKGASDNEFYLTLMLAITIILWVSLFAFRGHLEAKICDFRFSGLGVSKPRILI